MLRFKNDTWMTYDLMTRTRYKPESRLDSGFVALFSTHKDGNPVCQKAINQMASEQLIKTNRIDNKNITNSNNNSNNTNINSRSKSTFFCTFYCKQIQWNKLLMDVIIIFMIARCSCNN